MTTTAAVYARKSTDDSDRDPANKSVTRQVEHAQAYAASKGWTVLEEHIYVDDGISGAEFENRPGFARLIADLPKRRKPPFDVLIMSEGSRLGRDQQRNGYYLAHIRDAGVRIFYYLDDAEERLETPEQVLMSSVKSYAAEVERIKAGQRSRDALARRAAKGYNAGGVVYGYDNVPVVNGDAKSHTDYRINEAQAVVLRSIFRMHADGYGHTTIAKTLNRDPRCLELSRRYFGGARPAAPRKGTGSWAPSSVRAMICNERYTGVVPFGAHRKVYRHGTRVRVRQPEADVRRAQRDDLRIIPDGLWREVRARFDAARKTYLRDTRGKLWGRPGTGVESKYLLTGLGECAQCGHNITMVGGRSGSPGKRKPTYYYGCAYHQNRGSTVCANDHRACMEEADALVLSKVREHVLTPEAINYTIDKALGLLAARRCENVDLPKRLEAELRKERRQRDNFLTMIADGKAPISIVERIAALDRGITDKEREFKELRIDEPTEAELRRLRAAFKHRLGQFDKLLLADVPLARQALRKLLAGRIEFLPEERDAAWAYRLRWAMTVKPLLEEGYIGVASPRGFEPRLPP